jgi:hypothetical protein
MSVTLLNCYKFIDNTSIEEFADVNAIDSLSEKNKGLLEVERWGELFRADDNLKLDAEMDKLNDALIEFVPEDELKEIVSENEQTKEDMGNYETKTRPHKGNPNEMLLLGVDISEPVVKYTLGFSFLILFFAVLYFLLYKVMRQYKAEKVSKISKKKK